MRKQEPRTFNDFQAYAQLLVASQMFNNYLGTRATLKMARKLEHKSGRTYSCFPEGDVEPEWYAENWIKEHIVRGTEKWKESVFKYFINLLVNYSSEMRC